MSRSKRKTLRKKIQWGGIFLVLLWMAFLLVTQFPFRVHQLKVVGANSVPPKKIVWLAGIEKGMPLFGSWVEDSISNILRHRRITDVQIRRNITGDVVIQIFEGTPAAAVHLDQWYYVDSRGRVLESVSIENVNVPIFTGPWSGRKLDLESLDPFFQDQLKTGTQLMSNLLQSGIPEKDISEIHLDPKLGWIVYRIGLRIPIIFGHNQFEEKTKRLIQVLNEMNKKHTPLTEIDLDFRDRVVVRVRSTV